MLADYRLQGLKSSDRVVTTFRAFMAFCGGDIPCESVTADLLMRYAAARIEKRARGTVHLDIAILRRAWHLMRELGRITETPIFPRVRPSDPRQGFFELAEMEALSAHLQPDVRPLVWFLYYTGWRRGEAFGLKWDRVDFEAGIVRLDTSKTRHGRVFPFAVLPPLAELMREQRIRCDLLERLLRQVVPWVFVRIDGRPIRDIRTTWAHACRAAGVPGRIVHDLRRTAVRNLERAGVPRSVAMQLTGHRTARVYDAYAIVSERDLAEGVERLARHVQMVRRGGRVE